MPRVRRKKWSRMRKPATARLQIMTVNNQADGHSQPTKQVCPLEAFRCTHEVLIATANTALATCLRTHRSNCPAHPFDATGFLPTRLLDLENLETPKLLLSTEIQSEDRRYVCLSHQWGHPDEEAKLAMTTIRSNLQMRLNGIDLWTLPKRYQEAMMICKLIGIRYIWIDSLCIIQDLDRDWKHQASMMARVYECGIFTISSNMPVDDQQWRPPNPYEWIPKDADEDRQSSWLSETLLNGPLAKRAWCLQERYMSPRILHIFEGEIWIWECDSRVRAACRRGLLFRKDVVDCELIWRRQLRDYRLTKSELSDLWCKIVTDFGNRTLSCEADKLPAISGIAAKLQPRLGTKYLAGVWENDLYALLWCIEGRVVYGIHTTGEKPYRDLAQSHTPRAKTPLSYRAPSWSWASIDSPFTFEKAAFLPNRHSLVYLASLKYSHMIINEEEPFGQVMEGSYIILHGYFWKPRYSNSLNFWSYFEHRPDKSLTSICYFVICCAGFPTVKTVSGLILTSSTPNIYKRIGLFIAGLDQMRNFLDLSGIISKFKDCRDKDLPELFSLLGEKVDITLI